MVYQKKLVQLEFASQQAEEGAILCQDPKLQQCRPHRPQQPAEQPDSQQWVVWQDSVSLVGSSL